MISSSFLQKWVYFASRLPNCQRSLLLFAEWVYFASRLPNRRRSLLPFCRVGLLRWQNFKPPTISSSFLQSGFTSLADFQTAGDLFFLFAEREDDHKWALPL